MCRVAGLRLLMGFFRSKGFAPIAAQVPRGCGAFPQWERCGREELASSFRVLPSAGHGRRLGGKGGPSPDRGKGSAALPQKWTASITSPLLYQPVEHALLIPWNFDTRYLYQL
jgi:hypothetical protein